MEQCPSNSGCFRGVCCPLVCPSGQDATGFCGQTIQINLSCSQQVQNISFQLFKKKFFFFLKILSMLFF